MVLGYTCLELFNVISDICTNRRRRIVVCQAMELVGGSLVPPLGRGLATEKKNSQTNGKIEWQWNS